MRTILDWRVPVDDFGRRSQISTSAGVATLLLAAFVAAWRSRSARAGLLVTVVVTQVAAIFSVVGAALIFAIWHDPATQQAITGSGGLEEVSVLPFMMAIPGVILGTVGGVAGSVCRRPTSAS